MVAGRCRACEVLEMRENRTPKTRDDQTLPMPLPIPPMVVARRPRTADERAAVPVPVSVHDEVTRDYAVDPPMD